MKYSVKGTINTTNGDSIIDDINKFKLWKLNAEYIIEEGNSLFVFECWLSKEEEKTSLFNMLKVRVDASTGKIDWHKCTHDEIDSLPCVIEEEYRG